ncbi:hypothetical protein L484_023732 [Morus notabilis]|uniref:Uncharacterized protein n=1 Tax=Morus notabilis TaxID=981085 RepID=W9QQS0_9ROSA|nr:hypothetical protein L484_023732 [Morus notabilis]
MLVSNFASRKESFQNDAYEDLYLGPCPQTKEVPSELEHLKNIKILVFHLMPLEFMMSQDFRSISHVPGVGFRYINDKEDEEASTSASTITEHHNQ